MKAFSELLDRLVLTPSRNGKLRLLRDYFAETPDPDRGYALAALTDGGLDGGQRRIHGHGEAGRHYGRDGAACGSAAVRPRPRYVDRQKA